jgi:GTPase SAR1 family protein
LLLGQSGAGKTTFIESFLNILLGIDYYDPFRFKMIDERGMEAGPCGSTTSSVTIYHIPSSWIKQARFITH